MYMDELNELQELIGEGKKVINRIMSCLEYHEVEIPVILDLEQALDMFKYMRGWVDCLENSTRCPACVKL